MTRIAYFDCFSGISGDMTVGAFIDAGLSFKVLSRELAKLKLGAYCLKTSRVIRCGISGTKFDCIIGKGAHAHRTAAEIGSYISKSSLSKRVKDISTAIFGWLGTAEARVHGAKSGRYVRLHEIGDTDSIVDIVSCAIAVDEMGIDMIYSSPVTLGRSYVGASHGFLPVPAPATVELLKNVPVSMSDADAEIVTPTGAAILKTLSEEFGRMPAMRIDKTGYGAGALDFSDRPNMLRLIIGSRYGRAVSDSVTVMESNIDDMSPQIFERLFERLFSEGALDVYVENILMKKTRPAYKLTVLCRPRDVERLKDTVFSETTTIGVRFFGADRFTLNRKIVHVRTNHGKVRMKISGSGGAVTLSPEYDDCVRIARKKNIPLKIVFEEARNAAKALLK